MKNYLNNHYNKFHFPSTFDLLIEKSTEKTISSLKDDYKYISNKFLNINFLKIINIININFNLI